MRISTQSKATILIFTLLILTLMLSGVGCGNGAADPAPDQDQPDQESALVDDGQTWSLTGGHVAADGHPMDVALKEFATLIEERTDGRVTLEIFAEAQLGGEREMIEGATIGTIDVVLATSAVTANFVPEMALFDLPFLFESRDDVYRLLDGEIGQNLLDAVTARNGLVGIGYYENGFRNLTNSRRPVASPADVSGLKIRTMENEMHMEAWRALGADPTPMAWHEVFTALQQGVVDGQENPLAIIATSRIFEVQSYLSMTNHNYSPMVLMVSENAWESFSDEIKQIIIDAAAETTAMQRAMMIENDDVFMAEIAEGVDEVVENVDFAAFQEAVQAVYEKYTDDIGREIVEAVLAGNY